MSERRPRTSTLAIPGEEDEEEPEDDDAEAPVPMVRRSSVDDPVPVMARRGSVQETAESAAESGDSNSIVTELEMELKKVLHC